MSVQAIGWVLDHSPAQGTDRLVLISLANHAGQSPADGAWESWPGIDLIQHEAGLDRRRTVQDALGRLEAAGLIVRVVNGAPDSRIRGDRRPNLYRIPLVDGVTPSGIPHEDDGVTPDAARGDAQRHDGVTRDDTTGCRDASPEPSVEPSVEPSEEPSLEPLGGFAAFWESYPKRNNKRLGRGTCERIWARLSLAQRADLVACAENYADACARGLTIAKDPERFMRPDVWPDWRTPAAPDARGSRRQQSQQAHRAAFVGDERPTGAVGRAFYGQSEQKALGS